MKYVRVVLLITLISTFLPTLITNAIQSQSAPVSTSFEEPFLELGYKSVEDALRECEKHFERELKIPLMQPPIEFTHQFGRCNNLDGDINDSFEIEYLHQTHGAIHYMVRVKPLKHKYKELPNKRDVIQTFILKDGNKAFYGTTPTKSFNLLVFEKGKWQYTLCVDQRIANKVTAEVLVNIANSICPSQKAGYNQHWDHECVSGD